MIIGRALSFLFELVFGFLTRLVEIIIWVIGKGISIILTTEYDMKELFGFDYKQFLPGITMVCACFLIFSILLDVVKAKSGIEDVQQKTAGEYFKRIIAAYVLCVTLPLAVKIWQIISDALSKYISAVMTAIMGNSIEINGSFSILQDAAHNLFDTSGSAFLGSLEEAGKFLISLIFLITVVIGFILIGVSLMKRYVELLIASLFIPYIAITVYKDFDKLNTWFVRLAQIFIGYVLNIVLFYIILGMSTRLLDRSMGVEQMIVILFLLLAVLSVAINGSNSVKDYIYSGGTGNQASSFFNMAGRELMKLGRGK